VNVVLVAFTMWMLAVTLVLMARALLWAAVLESLTSGGSGRPECPFIDRIT
jgi:hypothetical protein